MEAFSLLKYWRGGGLSSGGGGGSGGDNGPVNLRSKNDTTTTTIVTAIANHTVETDDDEDDVADDDGPFFDLEFAVPDDDEGEDNKNNEENASDEEENDDVQSLDDGTDGDEREFKFTLSSNSSNDRTDPNLTLSPSDDLFFKGRLVPIEPFNNNSEQNSKPQFPVSLLKSATKFRVFMLGFKKSKTETNGSVPAPPAAAPKQQQKPETEPQEDNNNNKKDSNKFFTVKFKVEEVPIMSLFTRDNSSRNSSTNKNSQKQNPTDDSATDEKKFSKDVMQKYLKKVKPLYIRVSKRYGEKLRFSGQLSLGSGPKAAAAVVAQKPVKSTAEKSVSEAENAEAHVKSVKQGNIPAGLRVVCKHLGKSRSASSAVAAAPPAPSSSRRDDSLLQQQDGIQSAILHCKRSFNASRDCESTILPRSVSDPSHEKSIDLSRKKSSNQGKLKECCDF